MKNCKSIYFLLLLVISFVADAQQLSWTEAAPGVWKAIAGKPEAYDLLKASGAIPNTKALSKMAAAGFPLSEKDISGTVSDGKTYLRFPLDTDEQLFGFGLNFQTVYQ